MKARYSRNIEALSVSEVALLHTKKVCVIGCGGLGGYIAEMLARVGVLHLTLVDCDVFDESNLNRQLFSTEQVLGQPKAEVAKARIAQVNSEVTVNAVCGRFDADNATGILQGHDLAMDALDSAATRLLLGDACAALHIPLVHGAIGGWYGQVANVFPGDGLLRLLYPADVKTGTETRFGNLPFTAAMVASLQCAEAVKILTGREPLRDALLRVDLLNGEFDSIKMM